MDVVGARVEETFLQNAENVLENESSRSVKICWLCMRCVVMIMILVLTALQLIYITVLSNEDLTSHLVDMLKNVTTINMADHHCQE